MITRAPADTAPNADFVDETASQWFARRREGLSPRDEERFRAWLAQDPLHSSAYARVTHSWELSGAAAAHPAISAMRSEALMLGSERRWKPQPIAAGLAALIAIVAAAGLVVTSREPATVATTAAAAPRLLQTAVGERSSITLADGSIVTLNTNSRVQVNYSDAQRNLLLVRGQALFQVAKNADRPFIVTAGNRRVTAIGTQFEVRLDNGGVRVALLEGKVRVQPLVNAREKPPVLLDAPNEVLEAGDLLTAGHASVAVKTADVAELTSWREGRVRFDDTPLAEAAAEMNRYTNTRIIVDRSVASIRVSGAFRTGQSATFVAAVTELLPVTARREADAIHLSQRS